MLRDAQHAIWFRTFTWLNHNVMSHQMGGGSTYCSRVCCWEAYANRVLLSYICFLLVPWRLVVAFECLAVNVTVLSFCLVCQRLFVVIFPASIRIRGHIGWYANQCLTYRDFYVLNVTVHFYQSEWLLDTIDTVLTCRLICCMQTCISSYQPVFVLLHVSNTAAYENCWLHEKFMVSFMISGEAGMRGCETVRAHPRCNMGMYKCLTTHYMTHKILQPCTWHVRNKIPNTFLTW